MALVTARGLRKTYRTDGANVYALDDIDLDVEEGSFVAVMGPSGSGKSTLLHMLGALDVPDGGEVTFGGRELSALSRTELAHVRRRQVGFVFQFFNLVPVLTVEENVGLPLVLDGVAEAKAANRVAKTLSTVGLDQQGKKLPAQLSGGEQQRAAVARAVINDPVLLLADEPTGNLDRRSGADVMSLLRSLNEEGQTLVVVTHDPTVAGFAPRVVFMRDGKLVDEMNQKGTGNPSRVLARLTALEG
jgi:putative ABC transport system ATP-binding protein